ncbi:unnamed protein product [Euphydryas editha]|uniref:C2H2-type domain-containing protein n=1 Tax=Euphydryas editha TaxID=104508 RepID=A0AAU9TDF9_EUPED|nr:unnamed protein product [Euphydryas editha]
MESKKDVYVISLDAVDLNILPISQKSNDGRVIPLWSKSNLNLRSNEYYEFKIKTNDRREERNDQVIENVICHICDINVPKIYFNEHKNSFRHKFNAKIADIALKRLQLFMNKVNVKEINEKIPSKYYCSECSLVIDSDDEISHKQSIVHRNSIFLERFLNDFLKFYTNDENEINDSKKDSKKIEVAMDTKQCEDSKKGVNSDKPNISETIIVSDLKQDSKNIEVANETKHSKDSKKGVDLEASNISETIIVSDLKQDSKNIEVANETKHSEDSKKGFDLEASNISVSDSKQDSKNIVDANETKHSEYSKKGIDLEASSISETIIVSDSKQDSKNIVDANETKHSKDSKKGVDLEASNISVSDSKQDSKKIVVANETKHCEDSKKGVDSDKPNISETDLINDSKEDSTKVEVAKETKHCEDSKKGFDSDASSISETIIVSDPKQDSKISRRCLDLEEVNKKMDSSSILHKTLQLKDEVVFETVDGGRFKVNEFNFNALMKISTLFEHCTICDWIFLRENRNLHLNSDVHSESLLQKLPDKNCIRKVNDTQNHCILCNSRVINYEVHIHSEEHITNFQNMIIPDERKKIAENRNNFNAQKTNVDTKSYSDILKSNKSESSTATKGHSSIK